MEETLRWIDERYLSEFDYIEVDSEIKYQKPFLKMREVVENYSISESESERDNTYLSYNVVTGDILDKETYLALQILEYAIVSMPGAPVKQALLEKGIGKDISGRYNNYILQPYFNFTAKNANAEDKDEFVATIREELEQLVKNGIDKDSLLAALNFFEFQYRENDFGSYPKGLMFSFQVFDSWLYDDAEPFRHLEQNEQFAKLREMLDTDYYEQLIKKYFLDNTHSSLVVLKPEKGLTTRKDEELRQKLAKIKSEMTEEEIDKLVEKTKNLKKYQETPSTKEQLDTIPVLSREDLSKEVEPFYNTVVSEDGITVVRHNIFTNGIGYLSLCFDITDIPYEMLSYLVVLKGTLGYMDTENYTYAELSNEMGIHTGGIYQEINVYRNASNTDKYNIKFEVKAKVFFEKVEKAIELIEEILFRTKLDDTKRLYEIICEGKSNLQGSLMRSSDAAAVIRNLSYISKIGAITEQLKGISNYKFIENLESNFEANKEDLVKQLRTLEKYVFRKDNLVVSYTANDDGYAYFKDSFGKLADKLSKNDRSAMAAIDDIVIDKKNEGFKTSAQVQYVTRTGDFSKAGYKYNGALRVLKTILNSEYLWKNIREQGGAYGCNCMFGKSGESYFSSYRDPNLRKTNEVFDGVPEYIRNFTTDERNMTKYIIGTISSMDVPLTALSKGSRSMSAYFNEENIENLQRERLQVLNANEETIRSFADLVEAVLSCNSICVVGNEANIEKDKDLFKTTVNLFE